MGMYLRKGSRIMFTLALLMLTLAGCGGSGQVSTVEQVATTYTTDLMKGNWEAVAQGSTGEQLAILVLLADQLANTAFTSDVRLVEAVDTKVDDITAETIVHVVRDMKVEGYGSITDDRQILYRLYHVDGTWKVYEMRVLLDY